MTNVPHFLRFARALALVSGVTVTAGCGAGTTGSGDAVPHGTAVEDSGVDVPGAVDAPSTWDGIVTGVSPWVDSGMGNSDARITGIVAYDAGNDAGFCCGVMPYDSGTDAAFVGGGVMPYDSGTADAAGDATADGPDVRLLPGGPMMPPEMPEDFA